MCQTISWPSIPGVIRRLQGNPQSLFLIMSNYGILNRLLAIFFCAFKLQFCMENIYFWYKMYLISLSAHSFVFLSVISVCVCSEILKKGSSVHPALLKREAEAVRDKHRSPLYCDRLLQHISSLPTEPTAECPEWHNVCASLHTTLSPYNCAKLYNGPFVREQFLKCVPFIVFPRFWCLVLMQTNTFLMHCGCV